MCYTVKKPSGFTISSWDVTKKLSLNGNKLIIPVQGEFGECIPAGARKTANHFLQCILPELAVN